MKTRAIVLALAAAGLISCQVSNNVSIEPLGVCAPSKDAASCAPAGECTDGFLAGADFWPVVGFTGTGAPIFNELAFWAGFQNQLPDNTDLSAGRVNTNDATIEEYRLSYTGIPNLPSGVDVAPAFIGAAAKATAPAIFVSNVPPPATTANPTPKSVSQLMWEGVVNAGQDSLVIVHVKAVGHYKSGDRFETGNFDLPVVVHLATFPGYTCPKSGEVLTAVCPRVGQTSSIACEAPSCALVAGACTTGADCCSGVCDLSTGTGVCLSGPKGSTCARGADCASGTCNLVTYTCN
jgi:hypothetical protein